MVTTLGSVSSLGSDYAEIARRPLEAERCALIVVDIQEKLLPPIFQKDQLLKNSQLLIPGRRSEDSARSHSATGQPHSLLPDTQPIDKLMFSCFGSDAFCSVLKRMPGNRNTVLLCGMESHICVMQTALGALREGYIVHVASDAVSSRTEWNWKIGLERMRAAGAVISSTEMILYELLRSSGSPAFKELLPYLKG
jgi:nicotinamidase-related amidase